MCSTCVPDTDLTLTKRTAHLQLSRDTIWPRPPWNAGKGPQHCGEQNQGRGPCGGPAHGGSRPGGDVTRPAGVGGRPDRSEPRAESDPCSARRRAAAAASESRARLRGDPQRAVRLGRLLATPGARPGPRPIAPARRMPHGGAFRQFKLARRLPPPPASSQLRAHRPAGPAGRRTGPAGHQTGPAGRSTGPHWPGRPSRWPS